MNLSDANNMAPANDWLLFDLVHHRVQRQRHARHAFGQPGANSSDPAAGLAAWSALFSGMVALYNSDAHPHSSYTARPNTTWTTINPAGVNASNSPVWQMVTNINSTRANTNLFPLGGFAHAGDILERVGAHGTIAVL